MSNEDKLGRVLDRLESLVGRVEAMVPAPAATADLGAALAFRWRRANGVGRLQGVEHTHEVRLTDLHSIDRQKQELYRNTLQFVQRLPANNALLWGSRGTGKSSLVKALFNEFSDQGLRLIEVDKKDLTDLPEIVDQIRDSNDRYVLFSDDLSFEANDPSYVALKAILDGSVHAPPENVLIYATSNRRHLLPEYMSDNLDAHRVDGEIHHSEAVEEKISLSERFGLWISFYPFKQDQYLEIAFYWLSVFDALPEHEEEARHAALQWALTRGSRSGRSAYQFALDWSGRQRLED
jgi:predicted AAA+ superfamily ATPase